MVARKKYGWRQFVEDYATSITTPEEIKALADKHKLMWTPFMSGKPLSELLGGEPAATDEIRLDDLEC